MATTQTNGSVGRPRVETDSMGKIDVPGDKYYGAQSARSLIHFDIGDDATPRDVMPREIIHPVELDTIRTKAVGAISGGKTVPQVFINGELIGSADDLDNYLKKAA